MDVSKNRDTPKLDGENNGNPYFQMDDLGVPLFLETPIYTLVNVNMAGWKVDPDWRCLSYWK